MATKPKQPKPCRCNSDLPNWELLDAQRIYCGRVCERCVDKVKAEYRPEIFRGYTQADVDEPIESDDY